jgi:hypothetical protein
VQSVSAAIDRLAYRPSLILRALAAQDFGAALSGPAPCDDCPHRARCAEGLACEAFALFVQYGTEERWNCAARQPNRETFERLFEAKSRRSDG